MNAKERRVGVAAAAVATLYAACDQPWQRFEARTAASVKELSSLANRICKNMGFTRTEMKLPTIKML